MSKKAEVINLEPSEAEQTTKKSLHLDSGRQVLVHAREKEEILEIVEPGGEMLMAVRLTEKGPIVRVQAAQLELKSTETIALEAKKVKIKAQEAASIESEGTLKIESSKNMDINSEDEIRVVGKMIHLN
ncbi:MAG: hypothetical protein PVF10_06975 [Syntrophobacterales bacterium]|jgi:hypothetical protein